MSKYQKTIDEKTLTLMIERRFQAPKQRVWDAYSKRELLQQWWSPELFSTTIKTFEFWPGGRWHYHMTGPDGTKYWSLAIYSAIHDGVSIEYQDHFSDEQGGKNSSLPTTVARVAFRADGSETLVTTSLMFASLDALQQLLKMGFEQGFASTCDKLDKLLAKSSRSAAR
jgi:uncharacterized protein YndB with AHSA1/START domain